MVRQFALQEMESSRRPPQCGDDPYGGRDAPVRGRGRVRLSSSMFGRAPYASPVASQLKRWLLNRRRASVQRLAAAAPVRRCRAPAERVDGTCTVYTPHPAPISRST
ncbi:MAG: hypothetical protein LCI00_07825 [Chloroflexi bacterium]|nr:hypothetical protein [Chloroflexota bacterium]